MVKAPSNGHAKSTLSAVLTWIELRLRWLPMYGWFMKAVWIPVFFFWGGGCDFRGVSFPKIEVKMWPHKGLSLINSTVKTHIHNKKMTCGNDIYFKEVMYPLLSATSWKMSLCYWWHLVTFQSHCSLPSSTHLPTYWWHVASINVKKTTKPWKSHSLC